MILTEDQAATILAVLTPLLGFGFFFLMTKAYGYAHLENIKDLLRFYFSPFGPYLMIVIKRLKGDVEIYYDKDIKISKSKESVVIDVGGIQYVTKDDPEYTSDIVSLSDARGPIGYPSPYGLAWRSLSGWAMTFSMGWIALTFTMLDDIMSGRVPSVLSWICTIMFLLDLMMVFGVIIPRLSLPHIRLVGYLERKMNPPVSEIVKGCSAWDSEPIDKCAERLGGKFEAVIPESVKEYVDALRSKIGSHALASAMLALIDMVPTLRKSMTELRREQRTIKEMARELVSSTFWSYIMKPTLAKIAFWLILVLVGVGIGYAIGSSFSITTAPPPWYNLTQSTHTTVTPAPMQTVTTASSQTITPAPPPTIETHTNLSVTPAPLPTVTSGVSK